MNSLESLKLTIYLSNNAGFDNETNVAFLALVRIGYIGVSRLGAIKTIELETQLNLLGLECLFDGQQLKLNEKTLNNYYQNVMGLTLED